MFWGFSESLDLYEEYTKTNQDETSEMNILLFGSGDPRHIIHTLAKSYRHNTKINFYVVDGCIEITARYILLICLALESEDISLKAKTHLFMDIYGNSLLRPSSYNYLASKANFLIDVITDSDYLTEKAPVFDIEALKYRERDGLEETFKFWTPKEGHVFNIKGYWETRLRQMLGSRYDYREGAFDWDLQMRLKDREAKQICCQEYRHWRETGVAFVFPEYDQSMANKSFVAGLARQGKTYKHRGYVGDISVGPFCAFGLSTSDTKMTNSFHGINDFRATDVTERNLIELFYKIHKRSEYNHSGDYERKLGAAFFKIPPHLSEAGVNLVDLEKFDKPLISTPNIKIRFLSQEEILHIHENGKFANMFDMVFVGNHYFQFLRPQFIDVCREKCLLMFETQARSILKKEEVSEFLQKIRNFAKDNKLREVTKFNLNVYYSVVKYKYCKEDASE
ncbi:dynein assembly factor 3, axonemal homolog [Hermetia illucens]|uniref:dynein assembly factor 3, axonemal homolog n=1 Tax=Hermetia illucens TaxID=343691 RepID=UPI0018CBF85E|nr:dynein assembly factor 3, axonemal homolog [Hermetia illucens]